MIDVRTRLTHSERVKNQFSFLGPLERRIMETLWREPVREREFTVRDMLVKFDGYPAYTTLMTTLERLFKKGFLRRRTEGRAFVYSVGVSKVDFLRNVARDIIDRFAGHHNEEALLASLVEVVSQRDRELLNELEHLVKMKRRELRKAD